MYKPALLGTRLCCAAVLQKSRNVMERRSKVDKADVAA